MTLKQAIAIGRAYRSLGDAVAEQLDSIIEDPSEENIWQQNSNALRLAEERFLSVIERRVRDDEELKQDIDELRMAIDAAKMEALNDEKN